MMVPIHTDELLLAGAVRPYSQSADQVISESLGGDIPYHPVYDSQT